MQENNQSNEVEELDINHLMQIRRDKLAELQQEGKDPYEITKFNRTNTSGEIKENYEKFDSMLKEIDEEYRTTLINFGKYKLVMFAMAKLMKMETTEQNKVALYLFNNINK